jgi:hypothetical protein
MKRLSDQNSLLGPSEATGHLKGVHSKNLFLIAKKKFFLLVCEAREKVDLKTIGKSVGTGARFAGHDDLRSKLGVLPGSVNPFSIMFDEKEEVQLGRLEIFLHQCFFSSPFYQCFLRQ